MTANLISDKKAVGFSDADTFCRVHIVDRRKRSKNPRLIYGYELSYVASQSDHNVGMLEALRRKLSGGKINRVVRKTTTPTNILRVFWSSPEGQKLIKIFKKNLPQVPNKRLDFLITLELQKLLSLPRTKTKHIDVAILHLIYKLSNQQKEDTSVIQRQKPLSFWIDGLNPSAGELARGKALAKEIYAKIDASIQEHTLKLPNRKLSKDYLIGFFWGDGGVTIGFNKSNNTGSPRLLVPNFTMTEPSKPFLEAVKKSFNVQGTIRPVGKIKGNCYQLLIKSWETMGELILPFLNSTWHPPYFQERIRKMAKFQAMHARNKHLTVPGWQIIVNEGYSMCENSVNRDPIDVILSENIAYYNSRTPALKAKWEADPLKTKLKKAHGKKLKAKAKKQAAAEKPNP